MIGVISDTHGLLRREALEALQGSELILHAGDIGPSDIIEQLRAIAPVHVVRGNCDHGPWAQALPETEVVSVGDTDIYMIHDLGLLDLNPSTAELAVVIYGHSHQPKVEERDGVLYLNPGSAGPKRFSLPVSVARLQLGTAGAQATIVELDV